MRTGAPEHDFEEIFPDDAQRVCTFCSLFDLVSFGLSSLIHLSFQVLLLQLRYGDWRSFWRLVSVLMYVFLALR